MLDWQHNRRDFLILTGYQHFGMIVTCNLNLSVDLFFCLLMFMNGAQMEILGKRMEKMEKELNEQNRKSNKVDYIKCLIVHIKIHKDVLQLSNKIEDCLAFSFVSQIIMSGLTICCITIEVAKVSYSKF